MADRRDGLDMGELMARCAAFFGAFCLLGCAQSWPHPAARPTDAVLDYEAGPSPREAVPPCVAAHTQGITLRSFFARGSEYHWRRVVSPERPVDGALAAELATAARHIIATDFGGAAPLALRPLPPGLQPRGPGGCHGDLELSAPAVSGDLAFVEALHICGENCANGMIYALRREGDGWHVIAVADTGRT
jgi:hypothetical protein